MEPQIKVTIYFAGDHSVGISGYYYSMEIPAFDPENKEEVRELIKALYTELDGEFTPTIFFDDEPID